MARRLYLFLISILISSYALYAQDLGTVMISDIQERTQLSDYLDAVSNRSGLRFYYSDNLLTEIFVYPTDQGKNLKEFLDYNLKVRNIEYLVYKGKNIIFIEGSQLKLNGKSGISGGTENGEYYLSVDVGDPMLAGKYKKAVLNGYIRSGKTGEPLPGAMIFPQNKEYGVVTDPSGQYSIELPVGKQLITFSYMGYEEKLMEVNMISPGNLDIELFDNTIAIDEVSITSKSNANVASTEMSTIHLDAKTIGSLPVLMGEADVIKSMTLMPGIQSSGDMASGFNVRGGNTDQNLILLDEVPIYNSTHLFGMFSVIDSRSINNIELYKGVAPARYGGRISSFLDIDQKEGNLKSWEGNGSLGLFSSKLTFNGPLIKDKASIIIGARTTYSDWILKRIPDIDIRNSSANFHDINAKISYSLNRKNRLNMFAYNSKDYFNLAGRSIYGYSNKLGSVSWNHISGDKYYYALNLFYTEYNTETIENDNEALGVSITSGIKQYGARFRILIKPWTKHSLEGGFEGNYFKFNPGAQEPYGSNSTKDPLKLDESQAAEFVIYLQDIYDLNSWLSISGGLRYSYFMLLGPATINLYESDNVINEITFAGTRDYNKGDIIKAYPSLEPRASLRAVLGSMTSLKLGLSRNYQNLHMLSNSTVAIPTDTWTPSNFYIKPSVGDQISVGIFKNFMKGIIETSIEGYYKRVSDVPEFKSGARLVMNSGIEQDILLADLEAYGVEFLFRKNAGRFSGWVGYTYSRSFMKTSGTEMEYLINNGSRYPSYYDKPHDLSLVANYIISRRFSFGSSFTYSTGKPTTYPESQFLIHNNPVIEYSDRNKYRLPDYHRLDLSLTWETSLKKKKKFKSSWVLSVYNVYGHKNVYSTYYKRDIPTEKNNFKKFALYELSIIGIPIPSITYNLNF